MGKRGAVIVDDILVQVTGDSTTALVRAKIETSCLREPGSYGPVFRDMGCFNPYRFNPTALCGNCFCTGRLLKGSPARK